MSEYSAVAPGHGLRARLPVQAALVSAIACAVVLAALATPLLAASDPLAALALRGFFSGVCHQNPARSFMLGGSPAAVCVRCLGIYCGVALGAWLSLFLGRFQSAAAWATHRLFLGALLLNALDVAAESFHLHSNLTLPRFAAGLVLGISAGVMFCFRATPSPAASHSAR